MLRVLGCAGDKSLRLRCVGGGQDVESQFAFSLFFCKDCVIISKYRFDHDKSSAFLLIYRAHKERGSVQVLYCPAPVKELNLI